MKGGGVCTYAQTMRLSRCDAPTCWPRTLLPWRVSRIARRIFPPCCNNRELVTRPHPPVGRPHRPCSKKQPRAPLEPALLRATVFAYTNVHFPRAHTHCPCSRTGVTSCDSPHGLDVAVFFPPCSSDHPVCFHHVSHASPNDVIVKMTQLPHLLYACIFCTRFFFFFYQNFRKNDTPSCACIHTHTHTLIRIINNFFFSIDKKQEPWIPRANAYYDKIL